LFLLGCGAYLLNRLFLKEALGGPLLHSYFNDFWLIPCALPLLLGLHRRLGWRDSRPPTLLEIGGHLFLWSLLFEWIGPKLLANATSDPLDVLCYLAGGLAAWAWWNRDSFRQRPVPA